MVTMVLAGERRVCAGGISSSWLMHLKEAAPISVRVMPTKKKIGKKLGELTGFTFEQNLEQRRIADHLGYLICIDAKFPFAIENKFCSKGN